MKTQTDKTQEFEKSIPLRVSNKTSNGSTAQLVDNRSSSITQRKLQDLMSASSTNDSNPVQRKANKTGLPDNLKSGIENLSGYSMDDVKVHYDSSKPAQLQAHAYAQGSDIHLASGQEKHLPHEAWHVVQQKQGRVKPTKQLKSKVNINDNAGLEKEADIMGKKALSQGGLMNPMSGYHDTIRSTDTIQSKKVTQLVLDGTAAGAGVGFMTHEEAVNLQIEALRKRIGKDNFDLGAVLKEPDISRRDRRYMVFRSQSNMSIDDCHRQLGEGITSGSIDSLSTEDKKSKTVSTLIKEDAVKFNKTINGTRGSNPVDLIKLLLFLHQGDGYDVSHFISTSTDQHLLFSLGYNSKVKKGKYHFITVIEVKETDQVYNMLDKDPKQVATTDVNDFNNEAEIDFVGGVQSEGIIWAMAIPMDFVVRDRVLKNQ